MLTTAARSLPGADPKRGRQNQAAKFRSGCKARGGTNRLLVVSDGQALWDYADANPLVECVSGGQINCGTSADGISDPAGSVSVRLRVHPLAGVHDGCTLIYVVG